MSASKKRPPKVSVKEAVARARETAKAVVTPPKQVQFCTRCGETGHNRRNPKCPALDPAWHRPGKGGGR